jgi:hypothetical protein
MTGNVIIIILLIPMFIQILLLGANQKKKHQELMEVLVSIRDRETQDNR